jgi:glucokinase
MILAGDIGGTNTRLAVAEAKNGGLRLIAEKTFPSPEQTTLEARVARTYEVPRVLSCCTDCLKILKSCRLRSPWQRTEPN